MALSEEDAKTLIDERLRSRGWNLTDFSKIRKEVTLPSGERADYIFFIDGKAIAIIEAKQSLRDLVKGLHQAKNYVMNQVNMEALKNIVLIFSSEGTTFIKQNLRARTLPERLDVFPTPQELEEIFHPISDKLTLKYPLRKYQEIAVTQVISTIISGRDKFYIMMATASGKTAYVSTAIVAKLFDMGKIRRVLFMVDRDALAVQAVNNFKNALGEAYTIKRLTLNPDDRHADVLVSTVQMLSVGEKYELYPNDFFDLIILDECHRSYFGEWHTVVEHFRSGKKKAIIMGQTATPSDRETVNTDRYFGAPIFRYTYRQGVIDGYLADSIYYKYATNVDVYGVHELGFDFNPEDLGRAVDVPQRNMMIAEKFFEAIDYTNTGILKKALVFTASIQHANNLRYALIRKYNELSGFPLDDAAAERFIRAIHTGMPNPTSLTTDFQRIGSPIKIAVSIDMLSTGIDAPDIDVLVMARPTKSRVLYTQMKGRGTRKCVETEKEKFILIDFVDAWTIEENIITNELLEMEEERELELPVEEWERKVREVKRKPSEEITHREMVILDVPVWLEYSEVIEPNELDNIGKQIETQLSQSKIRSSFISRFEQAVFSWRYFKGSERISEKYLSAMGFDLNILREIYGEPNAEYDDFVQVALGNKRFPSPDERKRLTIKEWAKKKGLKDEAVEFLIILSDFKDRNPNISPSQFFQSEVVKRKGGLNKVDELFKGFKNLWKFYDEMMEERK